MIIEIGNSFTAFVPRLRAFHTNTLFSLPPRLVLDNFHFQYWRDLLLLYQTALFPYSLD